MTAAERGFPEPHDEESAAVARDPSSSVVPYLTAPTSRKTAAKASKIEFSYTSGLFKDGAAHEPAGTCTTAIILVQRLTNAAQLARTLATPCSPVLKTSAATVVPAVQR
ncbi:hypothetical protein MY8738_009896 [Beauveria namnaoensis]